MDLHLAITKYREAVALLERAVLALDHERDYILRNSSGVTRPTTAMAILVTNHREDAVSLLSDLVPGGPEAPWKGEFVSCVMKPASFKRTTTPKEADRAFWRDFGVKD